MNPGTSSYAANTLPMENLSHELVARVHACHEFGHYREHGLASNRQAPWADHLCRSFQTDLDALPDTDTDPQKLEALRRYEMR